MHDRRRRELRRSTGGAPGPETGRGLPAVRSSRDGEALFPPADESGGPVLAFDTTGSPGSAAVLPAAAAARAFSAEDFGASVEVLEPARAHARNLLPAIRRLLDAASSGGAGAAPPDRGGREPAAGAGGGPLAGVGLLAATRGPGSFTGLRVGLATLGGLAAASGVPAVSVSALDAAALTDTLDAPRPEGRRLVVVDALRGELFAAAYEAGAGSEGGGGEPIRPVGEPFRLRPGDAVEAARRCGASRIAGPGTLRYREELLASADGGVEVAEGARPLAPAAARLALHVRAAGGEPAVGGLRPLYLRPPDIHGPAGRGPAGRAPA